MTKFIIARDYMWSPWGLFRGIGIFCIQYLKCININVYKQLVNKSGKIIIIRFIVCFHYYYTLIIYICPVFIVHQAKLNVVVKSKATSISVCVPYCCSLLSQAFVKWLTPSVPNSSIWYKMILGTKLVNTSLEVPEALY